MASPFLYEENKPSYFIYISIYKVLKVGFTMKKYFALFTGMFIALLALVSCGDSDNPSKAKDESAHRVDTLYISGRDTLLSKDTVIRINRDTVYITRDTLILMDTVYNYVKDEEGCVVVDNGATIVVECAGKESFALSICGNLVYNPKEAYCHDGGIIAYATENFCAEEPYDTTKSFCQFEMIFNKCAGQSYDAATRICDGDSVLISACFMSDFQEIWGFDTTVSFCFYNDEISGLYELCAGAEYDPTKYMCEGNVLKPLEIDCGGEKYNPETQFCASNVVHEKCAGNDFNPNSYKCVNDTLYPICGGSYYNPEIQFCVSNVVHEKCAGQTYYPSSYTCVNDTLYPLCGESYYNPESQFCNSSTVYDKCAGQSYYPGSSKCVNDTLYNLCFKTYYNTEIQFCYSSTVYEKCGGKSYNPNADVCVQGIIKKYCGTRYYDPEIQFCADSRVYDMCNGQTYTPSEYTCVNGTLKKKCGSDLYDADKQFCVDSRVYDKCNGQTYTPSEYTCVNGGLMAVCGSEPFDVDTQFCFNETVYSKCSGSTYDPQQQKCENDELFLQCGEVYYNPIKQFCRNGMVYPKCGDLDFVENDGLVCKNDSVVYVCDGVEYNPYTHYCYERSELKQYGKITDERDGNVYRTVNVGEQTWMADDLLYKVSSSGLSTNTSPTDPFATPSLVYYHWSDVMDSVYQGGCGDEVLCSVVEPHRGICPEGWHIPSISDWEKLLTFVGGVKEKYQPKSMDGTDEYGLSMRHSYYTSSTEVSTDRMYYLIFSAHGPSLNMYWKIFSYHVVRCLKD